MKAKLDQGKAEEILTKLVSGVAAKDLALEYGVSYATIASIREGHTYKSANVERPKSKKHLTPVQVEHIIQLWNEGGWTVQEIGEKFDRSPSCVYNICKGKSFKAEGLPEASPRKKRVRKSPMKDRARRLLEKGHSASKVMDLLGCSVSPVYDAKRELEDQRAQEQRQETADG